MLFAFKLPWCWRIFFYQLISLFSCAEQWTHCEQNAKQQQRRSRILRTIFNVFIDARNWEKSICTMYTCEQEALNNNINNRETAARRIFSRRIAIEWMPLCIYDTNFSYITLHLLLHFFCYFFFFFILCSYLVLSLFCSSSLSVCVSLRRLHASW